MKSVFARNMHRIRSHHQYTQEQSAKIIGISRQALGSYEEGRAEPSIENLFKICKGYGIADVGNFLWNPEFLLEKGSSAESIYPQTLVEARYRSLRGNVKEAVNILLGIHN
jgi:DNA-binding XRE family transcriptional regulator